MVTTIVQENKYVILSAKIAMHVNSHYLANFLTYQSHLLLPLTLVRMTLNNYVMRGDLDWPLTYFPSNVRAGRAMCKWWAHESALNTLQLCSQTLTNMFTKEWKCPTKMCNQSVATCAQSVAKLCSKSLITVCELEGHNCN